MLQNVLRCIALAVVLIFPGAAAAELIIKGSCVPPVSPSLTTTCSISAIGRDRYDLVFNKGTARGYTIAGGNSCGINPGAPTSAFSLLGGQSCAFNVTVDPSNTTSASSDFGLTSTNYPQFAGWTTQISYAYRATTIGVGQIQAASQGAPSEARKIYISSGSKSTVKITNTGSNPAYHIILTLPPNFVRDANTCSEVPAGGSCTITFTAPTFSGPVSYPASVGGANTNKVELNFISFNAAVTASNVSFEKPGSSSMIITNNSNAPVNVKLAAGVLSSGIHGVTAPTSSNCANIPADGGKCTAQFTASDTAYGSGTYTVEYAPVAANQEEQLYQTGVATLGGTNKLVANISINQRVLRVGDGGSSISLNPKETGPQSVSIVNTSPFTTQNLTIGTLGISGVTLDPGNCQNADLSLCPAGTKPEECASVSGTSCAISFTVAAGTLNQSGSFSIGSPQITTINQQVSVSGGVTFVPDTAKADQHIQYKAVSVMNSAATAAKINVSFASGTENENFTLCWEGKAGCLFPAAQSTKSNASGLSASDAVPACVYNKDAEKFILPAGPDKTCSIWFKTRDRNGEALNPLVLSGSVNFTAILDDSAKEYKADFKLQGSQLLFITYGISTLNNYQMPQMWNGGSESSDLKSFPVGTPTNINAIQFYHGDLYFSSGDSLYRFDGTNVPTVVTNSSANAKASTGPLNALAIFGKYLALGYGTGSTGSLGYYDGAAGSILSQTWPLPSPVTTLTSTVSVQGGSNRALFIGLLGNVPVFLLMQNSIGAKPQPIPIPNAPGVTGITHITTVGTTIAGPDFFMSTDVPNIYHAHMQNGQLTFEKVLGKDIWGPLVLYWSKQNNRLYIGDAEAHAMWEYTTKLKFLFPVTENGNSKPTSLIDYAGKTFYASYPDPDRIEVVEFHSISGEAKNPATGPAQPSFPNLFTAGPSLTITAGSASGDK